MSDGIFFHWADFIKRSRSSEFCLRVSVLFDTGVHLFISDVLFIHSADNAVGLFYSLVGKFIFCGAESHFFGS